MNSKCDGINCKVKEKCYRYTSRNHPMGQWYTDFWAHIKNDKCDYFTYNFTKNKKK